MGFGRGMKPSKPRNKSTRKAEEGALSQTQMMKSGGGSNIEEQSLPVILPNSA